MPTKVPELRQDHRGDRRQCVLCNPPDPTKVGKPRRACKMCKWHKYLGNGKDRLKASVRRKLQPDERR